ncbi:MAG: NAD-binding protein [Burkholderiaceae bacterium]
MSDVLHLIMRHMRAPMLCLLVVYGISVGGLTLMPGEDPQGNAVNLSIFHAFYIMSYTATTIGFGEVPYPFTDAQRLWVTISIYLSVVGWAYAVGSVFALINDTTFRATVARYIFAWRVKGLSEPFFVICGAGQSATALARAMDRIGNRLVVIDPDEDRTSRFDMVDFASPPLVLCDDARLPDVLVDSGILNSNCLGLMALAGDDGANQAIAIGARTLNPDLRIVARVKTNVAQVNLEAFGGVHVINPFETFATNVALDLAAPEVLRLEEWLTDAPDQECPERVNIPTGPWVLVGFGRFGHAISKVLDSAQIKWKAIDSVIVESPDERLLVGDNSEAQLREAGIERAAVIVAGTDSDATNLGVVTLARRVNPGLFVVIRQNHVADRILIETARADLRFVQADLIVHESLQVIKTPMLGRFVSRVRAQGGAFASRTIDLIQEQAGTKAPRAWMFTCDIMQPGMFGAFFHGQGERLSIGHLSKHPAQNDVALNAVALMLDRRGEHTLLPEPDVTLKPGDHILFVGSDEAMAVQQEYLRDPRAVQFVRTGIDEPRAWIFRWLKRWMSRQQDS